MSTVLTAVTATVPTNTALQLLHIFLQRKSGDTEK